MSLLNFGVGPRRFLITHSELLVRQIFLGYLEAFVALSPKVGNYWISGALLRVRLSGGCQSDPVPAFLQPRARVFAGQVTSVACRNAKTHLQTSVFGDCDQCHRSPPLYFGHVSNPNIQRVCPRASAVMRASTTERPLILKRASLYRSSGQWRDEDYDNQTRGIRLRTDLREAAIAAAR